MNSSETVKSLQSTSLDPFERLHEELHDLLLPHMDLLPCSEVSTLWNEVIGSSKKAMKRIQLKVASFRSRKSPSQSALELMKNSSRSYSNIHFESPLNSSHVEKVQVLAKFSDSVTELKLGHIRSSNELEHLELPNLVTLTIAHPSSQKLASCFLRNGNKIKKIVEDSELALSWKLSACISNLLKTENQIEHLELGSYLSYYLFTNDISSGIKLKLKHFKIVQAVYNSNIRLFLKTQAYCLESMSTLAVAGETLKFIVEEMKAIKSLDIVAVYDVQLLDFIELHNPSITELTIISFSSRLLEVLLQILPKLKHLQLLSVDDYEMEIIATTAHNLEKLFLQHQHPQAVRCYESLLSRDDVNKKIQIV